MNKIGTPLIVVTSAFAVLSFVPLSHFDVVTEKATYARDQEESIESNEISSLEEPTPDMSVDLREVVKHVPLPEQVKAIYMTSCVAGTPTFRTRLVELIRETEINSAVIDIKDYSGTISFPAQSSAWQSAWYEARCGTKDMPQLVEMLHDNGIYVIGRITVFQDPFTHRNTPNWQC